MYKGVKLPSEHISNFISQDKLTQVLGAGALSSRMKRWKIDAKYIIKINILRGKYDKTC